MPVDIKELIEGWLELESDPGLFTLLLEDFGVKGVQVEEIYDLHKPLDGPVYGFIFLFRWVEERRSRRKVVDQADIFVRDEEVVNKIFFAQQMVPNSCATHALVSVLLNCSELHLGATLERLRQHTRGMSPENKGWAIGNTPELAKAHNSHAMPQAKRRLDKGSGVSTGRFTGEAFHFVGFVPIDGRLFELDGLKPFPIDHGPWSDSDQWTDKFRTVIADRLAASAGDECNEIRFNLMAVVPDRRFAIHHKLKMLKTNRQIVLDALKHLIKACKDRKEAEDNGAHSTVDENASGGSKLSLNDDNEETINSQAPFDYAIPLTIETSPTSSNIEADASSEISSAFNSPTQSHWSQNTWESQGNTSMASGSDSKRLIVVRVPDSEEEALQAKRSGSSTEEVPPVARIRTCEGDAVVADTRKNDVSESHNFAPQDLLALLRNLESEILICEGNLKDETDKQHKYKVDDCRRTHNYDEFICTFLSMLAEQGKLGDLVQQHLLPKRLSAAEKPVHHPKPAAKMVKAKSENVTRRKKGRGKIKRRRN